jgi:MYXO-CTERM domain-containing protein
MNRIASLTVSLALGLLITVLLPAGAAHAAAYRYWGYFQWDGSAWQFATKGADQVKPEDGSVEGWRFATATVDSTRTPRVEGVSFDEICAGTDAEAGKKRVAVVIDYGRPADNADNTEPPEPVAHCASVDAQASGLEVLGAVADVRTDKALVCGVDGFPATGCGGEVKQVSEDAKAPDTPVELGSADESSDAATKPAASDDGPGAGTWIGIGVAVLAVLGLGAAALLRRRDA